MYNKWLIIIIFVAAAILLFYNLGGEFLWYDECSIAALAENVLKFGYPKGVYNGVFIWSHKGYRPGYAFISRPWLEIYLAALGRLIFGKTNYAVRIFFTLFGYLSIILVYFLSRKLFKNNSIVSFLSVLLLATSTPFLLQMRQCAYYSLVAFATLWMVLSYLNLLDLKKHSFLLFLSSSLFFLFSNYGIFMMVFLGCLSHYIFFAKRKGTRNYIISAIIIFIILLTPMVIYFKGFEQIESWSLRQSYSNISYYIRAVNKYILPYRFYLLFLICLFILRRNKLINLLKREERNWDGFYLFGCIFTVSLIMLAFERQRFLRYIINWVPLLMILQAYITSKFLKWNKLLGIILLFLIIFTNILHESGFYIILKKIRPSDEINKKAEINSFFLNYLYEITHKYEGPIAGIVTYLNKNAKNKDKFKTPYNVTGIMYYTGLVGEKDFSVETYPEWIIPRRHWMSRGFYQSNYYKNILQKYEKVELEVDDIPWENRPDDLEYHKFRTVKEGLPLIIFKRK